MNGSERCIIGVVGINSINIPVCAWCDTMTLVPCLLTATFEIANKKADKAMYKVSQGNCDIGVIVTPAK